MEQRHVKLSGDVEGSWVIEESLADGRLVVAPEWPSRETSAEAILQRAGAERLSPEGVRQAFRASAHRRRGVVAPAPSGPTFEVKVDERALSDDLAHASDAGREAIESMVERLRADGAPSAWLRRCDAEARDGTRLPGCARLYIPSPPVSGAQSSSAVLSRAG